MVRLLEKLNALLHTSQIDVWFLASVNAFVCVCRLPSSLNALLHMYISPQSKCICVCVHLDGSAD